MANRLIRRRDLWPVGALGLILAVTASWWALALWSVPTAPEWLERTRSVCFNITDTGLPDAKGWLLLLGQPPIMLALLWVGWGADVRESVTYLASSSGGRLLLGAALVLTLVGLSLASLRVVEAGVPDVLLTDAGGYVDVQRLDRSWPDAAGLVDQRGRPFTLASLNGGPALVTFAFGHCVTVCPVVVHQARAAREEMGLDVPIAVLTLDPWRDTPGRLRGLREQFGLNESTDLMVGGQVDDVEAALDAWGITRQRNARTGDIVHPAVVYLVEADGTVAFASSGARRQLVGLAERLGWAEDSR